MIPTTEAIKKDLATKPAYKSLFDKPVDGVMKVNQVSSLLKKLSNCSNCYIKQWCDKIGTMTDSQKRTGCQDMRTLWKCEVRKYAEPIDYVLINDCAMIDVKIKLQELQDGEDNTIISKQMKWLIDTKRAMMEIILKHYKPKKVEHSHEFKFSEGKIKVQVDAYETDKDN